MIKDRYLLVGVSHVSRQSKDKIKKALADFKPDIIALELDKHRYQALITKQKTSLNPSLIFKIGFLGYLFSVVGKILQSKIGKSTGVLPGEEMLFGAKLAKNNKLILCLIDQDIQKTLKNLSKQVTFKERFRLLKDLIFPKKKKIKFDVSKIPEDELIYQMIDEMRANYPGLYKSMVLDRNKFMARQVFALLNKFPDKKVMAIIGAGHKKGMIEDINNLINNNLTRN